MINFKSTHYYKDGELIKKDYPSTEGLNAFESVPMASMLAGIEIAIGRPAHVHKINGYIIIEMVDSRLYVTYNITPPGSVDPIQAEIAKFYSVQKK
ncbi:MAG: hypothetical protein E6H08_17570 [Bacteroidetes bacterium]|jgi:hypothetical protein|nr:MAG: hypothetical protein E6H08_17570 [Bacteroidota bacterium]